MAVAMSSSAEYLAIQKNRDLTCKAIVACADNAWFANRMVEEDFIGMQRQANIVHTLGVNEYDKCSQLLDAVEVQLLADPRKFRVFLTVLSEQPALHVAVDVLRRSYNYHCRKQKPFVQQQSHDSDSSDSPPESVISIPECNKELGLFITELVPLLEKHEGALSNIKIFLEHAVLPLRNKRLVKIFQPKKFQGVQSIRELFCLLAPHWRYIDCSLLHSIVEASRCKTALEKVEEFLRNREQLAPVLILQKHQQPSDRDTALPSSTGVLQEHHQHAGERRQSPSIVNEQPRSPLHEEVVEMKVGANVLTLRDYEENASLLCGVLKVPRYVMSFFSSGTGCISLKWLMSKELLPYVQNTRICDRDLLALARKHITEIRVGPYYQITIPSVAYWQEDTSVSIQEDKVKQPEEDLETLFHACSYGRTPVVESILETGLNPNLLTKDGWTGLHAASLFGHTSIVEILLNAGAQPDLPNNKDGQTALMLASRKGQIKTAALLVERGAHVNLQNKDGETALVLASRNGHIKTAALLVERGAHVNLQSKYGQTPLWTASFNGHTHLVDMLLKAGANPNIPNENGATALMAAAQEGHTQAAAILVEGGAQVNLQRNDGDTALMAAARNGHAGACTLLIERGAHVDCQDNDGGTALVDASRKGHASVCTLLIERGAHVDCQDNDGATALMVAAQEGHLHTATILVEGGAQVNLQRNDGGTALMDAARKGHASVCTLLIERGAHVDCQDNDGRTALWFSSFHGRTSVLEILLKVGGDLHIPNMDGYTALMVAAQEGHPNTATLLIEGGARVDLQSNDGQTALMAAARNGHASVCTLLIEREARVDCQNNDGRTALWKASFGGHTSVLEILLKAGGDLHIPNKDGYTALMVAAQEGHPNTATLLIEGGARVDLQRNNGWTALFIASLQGHSPVVDVLLKSGAHVNTPTEEGLTPLIAAVQNGHTEVVKQLLYAQADKSIKETSTGWTALHFAAKMGQIEIVQLLLQHGVDATILDLNQLTALDIAEAHGQDAVCQELLLYTQQNVPTEVDVRPQQHAEDSHGKSTANEGHEEQIDNAKQQSNNEKKTIQPKATRDKAQKAGRFLMALFERIEDTLLRNRAEKRAALLSGNLQGSETPSSSGDSHGKKQIVVQLVD